MSKLVWDKTGERLFETGVSKGVLYPIQPEGVYTKGYAWNGLSAVTESPSGAEATPIYADNIKYLNLLSTEECYEIRDMLVPFHLPLSLDGLDTEEVLALTKSDKKASFSQVNFILLKKIGKAFICSDVTDDEIRAAIEELKPKL